MSCDLREMQTLCNPHSAVHTALASSYLQREGLSQYQSSKDTALDHLCHFNRNNLAF